MLQLFFSSSNWISKYCDGLTRCAFCNTPNMSESVIKKIFLKCFSVGWFSHGDKYLSISLSLILIDLPFFLKTYALKDRMKTNSIAWKEKFSYKQTLVFHKMISNLNGLYWKLLFDTFSIYTWSGFKAMLLRLPAFVCRWEKQFLFRKFWIIFV